MKTPSLISMMSSFAKIFNSNFDRRSRSVTKLFLATLLGLVFSCQSGETDIRPLEVKLASDATFNALVGKTLQMSFNCANHLSSLNFQEKEKAKTRLIEFQKLNQMNNSQLSEATMVIGYETTSKLLEDLREIDRLKSELVVKFPTVFGNSNREILEKAIKASDSFKVISNNSSARVVAGGNCGGIYSACTTAVAVVGVLAVGACGPAAPFCAYGAVAVVAVGMELCKQEYIGCRDEQ